MAYTISKGLIFSKKGIPSSPRWFADNRLAIQLDETGITRVEYRNPEQKAGNPMVFLKGLHDGLRYYIEKNGVTYKAEYTNTTLWPFGIESEWNFDSVILKHSVYTIKDSIIIKLTTPAEMPVGFRFKLEFNEACSFIPADQSDFLLCGMGAQRRWDKWEFSNADGVILGSYKEKLIEVTRSDEEEIGNSSIEMEDDFVEASLKVYLGSDFILQHIKRNAKHLLLSEELKGDMEYNFVISFIPDGRNTITNEKNSVDKCALLKYKDNIRNLQNNIENQFIRYRKIINSSPRLISPYKGLNNFIRLAPSYHEALKVTEHPGAIRAKTSNYWVWGWDGLTSNCASLYWGDKQFIKEMLRFYEETAHPEKGIAHAYRNDMSVASISALPSQGMYITLLHHYYNATKDKEEVERRYSFAKKVYNNISSAQVGETGFCEGTSLFPDYPVYMNETGRDLSAFNNTVFYCASRSMEYLSSLVGDIDMSKTCKTIFSQMEGNFIKLFFDEEKGFIVNSIDSESLERRPCYSSDAVKWENEYCSELFETISTKSIKFFEENFVCKAGIRPMPVWDNAFDADANQLHSWWPVMGEYYMKLMNENNRIDLLNQWIGWVSDWTERLTIPEGIPCYINTSRPEHDRWDTLCGTWQAYSVRGFYQAILHGIFGVGIDAGGVSFYPYEGKPMKLKGLHYLNKTLDIEMFGSGRYIDYIEINGEFIKGTNKLPCDNLIGKKHLKIKVMRINENPYKVFIKGSCGLEFFEYHYKKDCIITKIKGSGTSRVKLTSLEELSVELNGKKVDVQYDKEILSATVEVSMLVNEVSELEIRWKD